MRRSFSLAVFILIMAFALPVMAQMDVQEIVAKASNVAYYEGNDGRADVSMTITDAQGRSRKRVFKILRLDMVEGKEQKYYVYFSEPADVQDMVYMVWKYTDKDDDRWMYLPALDLVRRIAASDKRSSFVGSNFAYEDISGRSLDLDIHELVSEDEVSYKIKNTPKDAAAVEFAYFIVYINKQNFMPAKAEYFDKQGQLFKTIEALEIQDIEGHPTVTRSKATDVLTGANTVTEFSQIKYDIGLSDDIFTERYLRRPPRQWLK